MKQDIGHKQAKILNRQLNAWLKQKEKIVVAIDGYTGIGKTTLVQNLSKLNKDITVAHRDDFLYSRKTVSKKFYSAKPADRPKVMEFSTINQKKFEQLILAFRAGKKSITLKTYNHKTGQIDVKTKYNLNKKALVVEGVFMFHPLLQNNLWDRRVYLNGNIKKIDARRVTREKARWGKTYIPETRPDSYFRNVTLALKSYIQKYKPEKHADLIIKTD